MSLSPFELAALIDRSKAEILRVFVDRVRVEVPGARGESRPYLEDHLSDVLTELAGFLTSAGTPVDLADSLRLAKEHAVQRARGEHYTIEDLRHEYRILRDIIYELVPVDVDFSRDASRTLGHAFDRLVSRSTKAFLRTTASEYGTHREVLTAHAALLESDAALKFTLASVKLGTWSVDFTSGGRFTMSSEAASMYGLASNEGDVAAAAAEVMHPADRDRVMKTLYEAAAKGTPYADEYRIFVDGEMRWIYSRGRAQLDDTGAVRRFSGIVLDISDRKEAQERLESTTRLLELAASGGRVGFWYVDTTKQTFEISETMAAQWGVDHATFPGTGEAGMALVHPDDRHLVREGMARALATRSSYDVEYRMVRPDGQERWIHAKGEYHEDDAGQLTQLSGVSIDMTERKHGQLAEQQTAAAVARERQTLEEVLEQTSVPTALVTGPDHVFTFANTAYRTTFSLDASILGRSVREVLPDAVEQGFGTLLDGVFRTGTPFVGTEVLFERKTADGKKQPHYVDFTYAAKRDGAGAIEGVLATVVDVTERVRLRQEIEHANALLRVEKGVLDQIFHSSPAGMAIFLGDQLVVERVNMEFAKFYGDRPLEGRPLLDAAPELRGQGFDDLLRNVMATGKPYRGVEVPVRIASQMRGAPEERYYDFAYIPLTDDSGRRYAVHNFALDVTDRVRGNRAISESGAKQRRAEHLLQRAISVAKIGFYNWDLTSNVVTFNAQMKEDWGIEAGTSIEEVVRVIHADDRDRVATAISKTLDDGAEYLERYRVCRPSDGKLVWIEAQGDVVVDELTHLKHWVGTSIDITQRIENEQTLRAATLEARNANVAKSAFLANMSHEIRTPLGAIMGFAELLRHGDISDAEIDHFVAAIERNSEHLLRIVDDILDLSKVEAGKMSFERIEFSLTELLSDFASLVAFRAREKGIDFSMRYGSPLPNLIVSDPTRLRQILSNVVGNAIKFTERGTVELTVSFERPVLTLSVRDTGRGLSNEQATKLFQAFVQADESTTRKYGGTGLGLVLTKRLANAMGGDFRLETSEPGVGSTFIASVRVELPTRAVVSRHASGQGGVAEKGRTNDKRRLAGLRVLVVDDSPDNRTLLSAILRNAGAAVETAHDGADGVQKALSTPYDAVVMDIQMPGVDGYQALKQLQAKAYGKPVFALTAHAMVEERMRATDKGFAGFLTKPVQSEALLRALDDAKVGRGESAAAVPAQASATSKRRVLVVEDDMDGRHLLEGFIRKRGFDVVTAADGTSALRALAGSPAPDVVLLDLTLPDMPGEDVLKAVRAEPRAAHTKVVVVSGWDDLETLAREMGADDWLTKPVLFKRLAAILTELLGSGAPAV